ncbi:MAG TPA: TrbC/VirB2 family protein [Micropepsaceae bacterium]|nr:TrbC/VirB2 family protein [Micropepsaceae bacterium]
MPTFFRRSGAILPAVLFALRSSSAWAQTLDPAGSNVIVGALNWLEGTMLGTVATVAAVIAIASVGFMLLTGRMDWRYGATVILGCFILFGAGAIVAGIRQTAGGF